MSVILWFVFGVAVAIVMVRARQSTVGFYRHMLAAGCVACAVGLAYSAVAKSDLLVFDASRIFLTLIGAVVGAYISIQIAQTRENLKLR